MSALRYKAFLNERLTDLEHLYPNLSPTSKKKLVDDEWDTANPMPKIKKCSTCGINRYITDFVRCIRCDKNKPRYCNSICRARDFVHHRARCPKSGAEKDSLFKYQISPIQISRKELAGTDLEPLQLTPRAANTLAIASAPSLVTDQNTLVEQIIDLSALKTINEIRDSLSMLKLNTKNTKIDNPEYFKGLILDIIKPLHQVHDKEWHTVASLYGDILKNLC